jgi:D-alanine-D-alanine ligase
MRIGLIYDLRDDYRAMGFSEEQTVEFDSIETIDGMAHALERLGHQVDRIGHGKKLAQRLVLGDTWDLVWSIAEGLKGRCREAQVPALLELYDQPYAFWTRRSPSGSCAMPAFRPPRLCRWKAASRIFRRGRTIPPS